MKKLLVCFAALGLTIASAKTYSVTLFQPSVIGGKELKPGDYKVEIKDQKMVLRGGNETAEAPVKVEEVSSRYNGTSVRYTNGDGKYHLQEIRLGGTKMKLVVNN